jgi:hypothetical protein
MAHLPRMTPDGDVSYVDEYGLTHASYVPTSYEENDGDVQTVQPGYGLPVVAGDSLVDGITTAAKVISYAHHEIHGGSAFCVHLVDLTFAKDGEMGILFTTPDTLKHIHMTPLVSVTDKSTFDILEAPTLDTGNYPTTFYTPLNRNRNSSKTSVVSSVRAAPVAGQASLILDGDTTPISGDGTNIHTEVIGGAKNRAAGEGSRDVSEYILKQNTTYYFRIVGDNTGTGDLGLSMEITWYEHTTPG